MLDCFGVYAAIRNDQGEIIDFRIEYVNHAALCHEPDEPGRIKSPITCWRFCLDMWGERGYFRSIVGRGNGRVFSQGQPDL